MNRLALQVFLDSLAFRRFVRGSWHWLRTSIALALISSSGFAEASEEQIDEFVISGGPAEVMSSNQVSVVYGELRFGVNFKGIHPYLIAGLADDSASYFGVGIFYPFELSENWRLTIASGPGYYDRNDSPLDLGAHIEFLTTVEISRRVWRDHRIGLSMGHISNASINPDRNPGSETLSLGYSIPLGRARSR